VRETETRNRIGPQDVLAIQILNVNEPKVKAEVTPEGDILFPQLGRIHVSGMTPSELEAHLVRLLKGNIYVAPKVMVAVTSYRSRKVLVLGEARKPGEVSIVTSMTLVELVTKVGGPSGGCDGNITLIRAGGTGESATMTFEIEAITAGESGSSFELQPGDIVLFNRGRKGKVYVAGEVRSRGAFPIAKDMTVQQVIILAGGLTDTGSERKTYILRTDQTGQQVRSKAQMSDILEDGDTVIVEEGLF